MATEKERIDWLHGDLRRLLTALCANDYVSVRPFLVSSHRTRQEQDDALKRGTTRIQYPMSAHNQLPSLAMDIQALDLATGKLVQGDEAVRWCVAFAHDTFKAATDLGIKVRWGGLWSTSWPHGMGYQDCFDELARRNRLKAKGISRDTDGNSTWVDAPHFELLLWDNVDKKALLKNGAPSKAVSKGGR